MLSAPGGLAGYFAGQAVCQHNTHNAGGWLGCLTEMAYGTLWGALLGYSAGVWWAGEAVGGDGSLLALLAGTAVGALAFMLPPALGLSLEKLAFAIPVAVAAPIIGYELSQRRQSSLRLQPLASSRPRLQPVLAVSSRGAVLGLGGTF